MAWDEIGKRFNEIAKKVLKVWVRLAAKSNRTP